MVKENNLNGQIIMVYKQGCPTSELLGLYSAWTAGLGATCNAGCSLWRQPPPSATRMLWEAWLLHLHTSSPMPSLSARSATWAAQFFSLLHALWMKLSTVPCHVCSVHSPYSLPVRNAMQADPLCCYTLSSAQLLPLPCVHEAWLLSVPYTQHR